jgi:hypothetical protein
MGPVQTRAPCRGMWLDGVWWLGHGGTDWIAHRVVVMERGGLRRCRPSHVSLSLHWVRSPISIYSGHGCASYTCPRLVRGVVKQSSNVMNKERIQLFGDLLFVGKFQSTLEGDPEHG